MNDAFGPHLIGLSLIVRIVRVEGHDEPIRQPDPLSLQILEGADAGQAKPVGVVRILEISIDSGYSHDLTPFAGPVDWD